MPRKLNRLILVDGNALVHRAYHALPPLTTRKGEIVNAVYGFTTLLLKAIADLKPEYVAVAFDLAGPTFRHEAYKEYKATRVKGPDDLYAQFDRVKEVVGVLNIPIFGVKGFEADDVIGTLSHQAVKKGIETIIVTGDMDSLQLVNRLVKVYTMRQGLTDTVIYDGQAVKEKYGLTPEQFVDFKALKGDASDNIPGVDGIGEKTATTLIQAFGSLDDLYKWLEKHAKDEKLPAEPTKISPRIRGILLSGKQQAYDSQHLSRIVLDVPIELDLAKASLKNYDRQPAIELLQELEFHSLLTRLPAAAGEGHGDSQQSGLFNEPKKAATATAPAIATQVKGARYHCLKNEKEFAELLKKLAKAKDFVLDTETDYLNGPVIGLSFATHAGEAWYAPVTGADKKRLALLKPILEDKKIAKIGHNMKYDYLALRKEGIEVTPLAFDTMIASYLLNSDNRQHNLDAVAFVELGVEKIPLTDLIGVKKLESLATVEVEKVAQYASEDADITYRLYERFAPQLEKYQLKKVFYEIDVPLVPILGQMEEAGIKVDTTYLNQLSKRYTKRVAELTKKIYHEAGQEFNINSPAQLSTILTDKLRLTHPDLKKNKNGISTAASELEKLKGMHPIIDLIFAYRELTKLLNTYIDVLPKMVDQNSRLHTSYSQTIAATGRLSSNDPNLQNIPVRTEIGREIRQAFVAEKNHQLISIDYSQIELRVAAHMAGDRQMIKAFKAGRDIHQEVADALGVDRRVGKTLNFAVLYGQGPYTTAQMIGAPLHQAKLYIENYFKTYAKLHQLLDKIYQQAKKQGYVETMFGRRRYIPAIASANFNVRAAAERVAKNMPLQGSAADIMKLAMIAIARSGELEKHDTKMLLQVHDELVFEAPTKQAKAAAEKLQKIMEQVYELKVPLVAEASIGDTWGKL